jgi:lipopolysaccharide export system protein LptA
VELRSEEQSSAQNRIVRTWRSAVADINFQSAGSGRLAIASIHGSGNVQIASEGSATKQPVRFSADDAVGRFGANAALLSMTGAGHAVFEQSTPSGARQRTAGDHIDVRFAQASEKKAATENEQIESATVDGNVVLLQEPRAAAGQTAAPLRATAGRAQYDSKGAWLHLTLKPRVRNGALDLSAERIDFSQASGDAYAHGDVKAAWTSERAAAKNQDAPTLGGNGPIHAIAAEAHLHRDAANRQELLLRSHARLWQGANSIEAPEILLDRAAATLKAKSSSPADPVRAVFLSASAPEAVVRNGGSAAAVIRVRGAELTYSDADRRALMRGAPAMQTKAETATGVIAANDLEIQLAPQGAAAGQAQVERMTARGRVVLSSQGRTGAGERLEYQGKTGEYVLTGTPAVPPRAIDPARGEVTGERLIFQGRDNSVTIEGGARKTRTETTAPR